MNRKEVIDLLNDLESKLATLPNQSIVATYWPVWRMQLGYRLTLINEGKLVEASVDWRYSKMEIKQRKPSLFSFLKTRRNISRFISNVHFKRREIVYLGFAEHYYLTKNKLINNYLSPAEDLLSACTNNSESWLLTNRVQAVDNDFYRIWRQLYNLRKQEHFSAPLRRSNDRNLRNLINVLLGWLRDADVSYSEYFESVLWYTADEVDILNKTFVEIIKKAQPKLIWTYAYYDIKVMTLIHAARSNKINVVEYQHSVQSDEHFAYGRWEYVQNYFRYLPTHVWVWTLEDGSRLKKNWASNTDCIIGGKIKVVLDVTVNYKYKLIEAQRNILIALQGDWIPQHVLKCIEETDQFRWFIRWHPRYDNDRILAQELATKFPEKVEIDLANSLPLDELFTHVNFVVTDFSGTAVEGFEAFCKILIIGDRGEKYFKSHISDNIFLNIRNSNDLLLALKLDSEFCRLVDRIWCIQSPYNSEGLRYICSLVN